MNSLPENTPGAVKITHQFKTGNACVVDLPAVTTAGQRLAINCQWERFPPSQADVLEYSEVVYPQILSAVEKALGPKVQDGSQWVEILPGLRLLVRRECVQ